MDSIGIPWGDGTVDYLICTYSAASGNQTVTISSGHNKGLTSRTKKLKVSTSSASATMTITQARNSIGSMKIGSTFVIPNSTSSVATTSLSLDDNEGSVANESLGIAEGINLTDSSEEVLETSEISETSENTNSSNGFFSMLKRLFS